MTLSDRAGYALAILLGLAIGTAGTCAAKWAGLWGVRELPWWGCAALPAAFLLVEAAPVLFVMKERRR